MDAIYRLQIAWGQTSFILGLFGNMFILYATIAHSAVKLDKMSIWIINNLAVADICNCLLVLLPTMLTQYGQLNQTLIFKEPFYAALGCYRYLFFVANLFLVNVLSFNKLVRCMFPLRNIVSTRRQRITVTIVTVFVSFVPTFWTIYGLLTGFFYMDSKYTQMDYLGAAEVGNLLYSVYIIGDTNKIINYTIICILNFLPCITLVLLNSALVGYAVKKSNSAVNKKNFLIVVLVTIAFLLSVIPQFADFLISSSSSNHPMYKEIAWSIAFLSSWINPLIYVAVNPTFRGFVKRKVLCCKRSSSVQQNTRSETM